MSKGIRLSPEHGVNPSVGLCFWCGKEDGTVVLPGRIGLIKDGRDEKAPSPAVWTFEPCPKCVEGQARGITFIEATHEPQEWPPFDDRGPYAPSTWLTGRWSVVTEDCVMRMLNDDEQRAQVLEKRRAHMDPETYELIFGDQPELLP